MITLKKISKHYPPDVQALKEVSLSIKEGEFVSIVGKSGSGKSTLMNILGFLDPPSSGEYLFHGEAVGSLNSDRLAELRRDKVGFVFQSFNLLPRLNGWKNVALPLRYCKVSSDEQRERAVTMLNSVGLTERVEHFPHEMSGGERQRIAIARALINQPSFIIADEPTGNLDSKTGEQIMALFHELHQQGKTVVMVTHDPVVAEQAQRSIHVCDGVVVS